MIADSLIEWRTDGCDREHHNRLTNRCRRRLERRLAAIAAEGVTVVRVVAAEDMQIDDAAVEVVEYDDTRGLRIRICATATPDQLLPGPRPPKTSSTNPPGSGDRQNTTEGRWRGLALRA